MRQTSPTRSGANEWDEATFHAIYGPWSPLTPTDVTALLDGSGVRWWVVGGRAARVGAVPREHEDTDVAVRLTDLPLLRRHLAGWHLWEQCSGSMRPLLVDDELRADCEQMWLRRDAYQPWVLDLALHASDDEWVFKRDARVRLPWDRALHTVGGVPYLRPEVAILHKAHLNRPKDRADLSAAMLTGPARAWLGTTLDLLGYHEWARTVHGRRE
jgi:aminoglycoside-2''-adenylyltransferase